MSDLQIGLLVIGAVIVAAVLLFNWIQERRFRKQADAAFQAPVGDALMQPGAAPRETYKRVEPARREPDFDAGELNEVAAANAPYLQIEPGLSDAPPVRQANASPAPRPAPATAEPITQPRPARPPMAAPPAPRAELIEYPM